MLAIKNGAFSPGPIENNGLAVDLKTSVINNIEGATLRSFVIRQPLPENYTVATVMKNAPFRCLVAVKNTNNPSSKYFVPFY